MQVERQPLDRRSEPLRHPIGPDLADTAEGSEVVGPDDNFHSADHAVGLRYWVRRPDEPAPRANSSSPRRSPSKARRRTLAGTTVRIENSSRAHAEALGVLLTGYQTELIRTTGRGSSGSISASSGRCSCSCSRRSASGSRIRGSTRCSSTSTTGSTRSSARPRIATGTRPPSFSSASPSSRRRSSRGS